MHIVAEIQKRVCSATHINTWKFKVTETFQQTCLFRQSLDYSFKHVITTERLTNVGVLQQYKL